MPDLFGKHIVGFSTRRLNMLNCCYIIVFKYGIETNRTSHKHMLLDMSLCVEKNPTIWVPTRSDTNRTVQSQKMEILDLESRGVAKTKALISFAVTVKLIRHCFRLSILLVFPCGGS